MSRMRLALAACSVALASIAPASADAALIGRWTFNSPATAPGGANTSDVAGEETTGNWGALRLHGTSAISGGELSVSGTGNGSNAATGWAQSAATYAGGTVPVSKTLIAWVRLDDLTASGSAIGLTLTGNQFDSVTYGEYGNLKWEEGSENAIRNNDGAFGATAVDTTTGAGTTRQVALSYQDVGGGNVQITGCLRGVQTAQYTIGNAKTFVSPLTVFGIRHIAADVPIGSLNAHIDEARIYDQAFTCAEIAQLGIATPTAVRWIGGTATVAHRGVRLAWHTGLEPQLAGFDVVRQRAGSTRRVKLTRSLILNASLHGERSRYRFLDRSGRRGDRYFVVEHDLRGATTVHALGIAR